MPHPVTVNPSFLFSRGYPQRPRTASFRAGSSLHRAGAKEGPGLYVGNSDCIGRSADTDLALRIGFDDRNVSLVALNFIYKQLTHNIDLVTKMAITVSPEI